MARAGVGWRLHLLSPTEVASRPPEGGLGAAATISRADAWRRIPSLLLGGSTTDAGPSQGPVFDQGSALRHHAAARPLGPPVPLLGRSAWRNRKKDAAAEQIADTLLCRKLAAEHDELMPRHEQFDVLGELSPSSCGYRKLEFGGGAGCCDRGADGSGLGSAVIEGEGRVCVIWSFLYSVLRLEPVALRFRAANG
jgi:hypothetical protein